VFLHGYLASSDSFVYQRDFFSKDFKVFAIDFKGFGKNKGMEYPYSLDDYVAELVKYLNKNGIVKPHVVAHSFGARVSIKALYKHPDLFDKLVVTGGAGLKPKRTLKKVVKKVTFNLLKRFCSRERLKGFYSPDYLALDPVMKESFRLIVGEHLDGVLPSIKNKTLLIYGKKDKETPVYMAKRFNKGLINSSLSIYENAGHFCFIDCPLKFNLEVREFLLSE